MREDSLLMSRAKTVDLALGNVVRSTISCNLRGSVLQALTSEVLSQPLEPVVSLTGHWVNNTRTISSMLLEARFSICSRIKCAKKTSEHYDG
jgi:hypothetical protein